MTAERNSGKTANVLAYEAACQRGDFEKFPPDSWLAFKGGFLFYSAPTKGEVLAFLRKLEDTEGVFITQVEPEVVVLSGFFTDPDGGLHRGIAATVRDDHGQEFPVFLEWGTNMVYPRLETPEN